MTTATKPRPKQKTQRKTPKKQEQPADAGKKPRPRALVTGASSGIGEEFARQLVRKGYDVVIVARRRSRLEALATELRSRGADVEVIEADLAKPEGAALVADRLRKGDISYLVNNAGFGTNGPFADLPLERELEEIDLNIRTLTMLTHAALGPMRERGTGTIVNVASTGAYQPVPYMSTYAATKAYVLSFSEAVHEEAKEYGVTVTCLCPGGTRTEFQQVAGVDERALPRVGWMSAEAVVKHAIAAAKAGSAIATPGIVNKTTANMARVFPRFAVRKIAGRMFKK